jgi:hypothetical protein
MNKKTMETFQELKSERVQEERVAVGEPDDLKDNLKDPLVISLKSERVQEPAASVATGGRTASALELAVNPYQRVTIDLPALQVTITLEEPVAGASWSAGMAEGG